MTTPNIEELVARAKRLRNELDDSNARLDRQCVTAMYEMEQALQSQAAKIDSLEAENKRLAMHIKHIGNDALRTENEALRKDAERYRWLAWYLISMDTSKDDYIISCSSVEEMSALIDAQKGTV
jgi:hypothetical protein